MSQTPPKILSNGRLLRLALAVSVGLNLLVAGLGVGMVMHGGPDRDQMARDLGFGPFSEALDMEQRRALRNALLQKSPELRAAMDQRRADLATLLTALRAQPYDRAATARALQTMRTRLEGQLALGQQSLADVLGTLSDADRHAFADRLERGQRRGGKDRGGKDFDGGKPPN